MPTFLNLILAIVVVLVTVACRGPLSSPFGTNLIPIPTLEPEPAGTPVPCPAALLEGRLVANDRWGLAIEEPDGSIREVLWPNGYTGRRDGDALSLIGAEGTIVARAGDLLRIGGGEMTGSSGNAAWRACGGIAVVGGS